MRQFGGLASGWMDDVYFPVCCRLSKLCTKIMFTKKSQTCLDRPSNLVPKIRGNFLGVLFLKKDLAVDSAAAARASAFIDRPLLRLQDVLNFTLVCTAGVHRDVLGLVG